MKNVEVVRTPIDTLEQAIEDIDRQNAKLEETLKINKHLKEGLMVAKSKTELAYAGKVNLLPRKAQQDTNRPVGFLGAGLAARAVEILEDHGGSMHVDDIFAIVSGMPGLNALSKESLRATMNSDAKRKFPRVVNLGAAVYDLSSRHPKQRRLKAA